VGYDHLTTQTTITAIEALEDGVALAKISESPFYAEGGGQVGDTGFVRGVSGSGRVLEVLRFEDDQVLVIATDGTLSAGESVSAEVDVSARAATEANHTATHLLHAALRHRLGEHVKQAGSLVNPDKLRFDFSHTSGLTPEDLQAIEDEVNEGIRAGHQVSWRVLPIDQARETGAMMLFGEKYGDEVRLVEIAGDVSRELCGGTHVDSTSDIRLMLLTSESSVAANTRRIEAITGDGALRFLRERAAVAQRAAEVAGVDITALPEKISDLAQKNRELERELMQLKSGAGVDAAMDHTELLGDVNLVAYRDDALSGDELIEVSDRLKGKLDPAVILLGSVADGKVSLVASASQHAVDQGIDAGALVRAMAELVGGGGGGRPTMARAGGKDPAQLDAALDRGRELVRERLGS
jgi:alanyl-tRNA synthetase